MIDHFNGDSAGLRFWERSRRVAVERGPGFFIDFSFQRRFQRAVRVVRAEEVRVPDKEAFFIIVSVDKPAGYAFGGVAADLTRGGIEHVHAEHAMRRQALDRERSGQSVNLAMYSTGRISKPPRCFE